MGRVALRAIMHAVATVLVAFVALAHVGFLVLEMFLWNTPRGQRIFMNTPEFAAQSAVLAANQGLYNGFLAAGLVWGLVTSDPAQALGIKTFFLGCVVVAGLYGGLTAKRSILAIQFAPAALALVVVRLAGG